MTAKEYLNQAFALDREADMILKKADLMEKSLYGRDQNSKSGIKETIEKIKAYRKQGNEKIAELVDIRIEIENAIYSVPDPIQRNILERRFLLYQRFDGHYDRISGEYIKGIYEEIGYSRRQMFRLYNKGLETVKKYMALNGIE